MTYCGWEQLVRIHLIPVLGNIRRHNLAPKAIRALQGRMIGAGKARAPVRLARAVLRAALRQVIGWRLIVAQSGRLGSRPKAGAIQDKSATRGLTGEDSNRTRGQAPEIDPRPSGVASHLRELRRRSV